MRNEKSARPAKRILSIIAKVCLSLCAFILLYLLVTFILSRIPVGPEEGAADEIDIYILTNGIHTDLVMPCITEQQNWFSEINHLTPEQDSSQYNYLAIGWGDKGFYLNTPTWSDLTVRTAMEAVLGLGGSAIHATYYRRVTESASCKKISISKNQYGRLITFILSSLDSDASGQIIKIETAVPYGKQDAFYEARGRYHIFNTCNSWANRGLKISGQKACAWTAFQGPIFLRYE